MTQAGNSTDSASRFLSNVERLLVPVYRECFSDETRKTRNLLLIVSFSLMLLALGLVAVTQQPVSVPVLGIPISFTRGTRWVLVALCGYFLVLHSARSYTEWSFWRLSHQAPMMELTELAFLQLSQRARHNASINSALKRKVDLDRELRELKKDPPVVLHATKRATELNEEYQRSGGQFEMFEEIMRLLNDVKRLRNEHQERVAAECDALEQQLRDQDGVIEESIRELEALGGKEEYLKDELQPLSWILKIRLGWEILFPTLFAVVAILMGILLPQAVRSSDWSLF